MAAYGAWAQPTSPQVDAPVFPPPPPPIPAAPQHTHKKHATSYANRCMITGSVDIPVNSPWSTRRAFFLSTLSAILFTCALVFHGIMFYYALETRLWVAMSWPLFLVPPVIFNSIYLAHMARKKVPAKSNINIIYRYIVFTTAYMLWAIHATAIIYMEGRHEETSYYCLSISVLALAAVACGLEWCLVICKLATEGNGIMILHQKCQRRKKVVVTPKNDGKIFKEVVFNMDKSMHDYVMNYWPGQYTAGAMLLSDNAVQYKKFKPCAKEYTGHCAAFPPKFSNTCNYENEKLKQDCPMKYNGRHSTTASTLNKEAEEYENEKRKQDCTEEDTGNSSFKNNVGQSNNTA